MNVIEKLESVRNDINKGYKTRAINRLQGLINAYPNSIEFREELGKVYESIEWREKSGLYYLLTESTSQAAKQNVDIYLNSVNQSGYKILTDLKFKGDKSKIPISIKHKLEELESKSKRETGIIPVYWHIDPNSSVKGHQRKESWRDKLEFITAITGLFLIIYLIIAGIIQSVDWLFY